MYYIYHHFRQIFSFFFILFYLFIFFLIKFLALLMADDPILDSNGTYGEGDEFAELTDAGLGVDGESFGQDLLGRLYYF